MVTKFRAVWMLALVTTAGAYVTSMSSAIADEVTNRDLSRQIEQLRQMIERLDGRVERLEDQKSDHAPPGGNSSDAEVSSPAATAIPPPTAEPTGRLAPSSPVTGGSLRDLWRGIHRGMTREQVSAILGPPSRMLQANSKPLWYYEYNVGSGSIAFDRDGYVEDWQKPPLGFWGLW